MYDYSKLRGRIVEKYGTLQNFAKAIDKDSPYISRLLNGKARITQEIIKSWCEALDIKADEIGSYFFNYKVYDSEQ